MTRSLITNALIFDGTGAAPVTGNVLVAGNAIAGIGNCLLYTSPSPRD